MFEKSLFFFTRDLRLEDNLALNEAVRHSKFVVPIFIFNPLQLEKENEYFSQVAFQFMLESLQDLHLELNKYSTKLLCFYGSPKDVLDHLIKHNSDIEAVFISQDYTPFAHERNRLLEKVCHNTNKKFFSCTNHLFFDPADIFNKGNKPYKVFAHFYKACSQKTVPLPFSENFEKLTHRLCVGSLSSLDIELEFTKAGYFMREKSNIKITGGRKKSHEILSHITKFNNYGSDRDQVSIETTRLSAYLKFGTHSIREVYEIFKNSLYNSDVLIRQLFWREFYLHIAYHFPHVFKENCNEKYSQIKWDKNEKFFEAWCDGKTGFPIVDAAMRELKVTGFIHNRARMIAASFLVKDLHIDWRLGEKYFAQNLIDYDPSINNGNWQWVASTGCDAQPYFRIFNPWTQQKKFDFDCVYIKRWVNELADVSAAQIHGHEKKFIRGYVQPCVNHTIESKKAIIFFKKQ